MVWLWRLTGGQESRCVAELIRQLIKLSSDDGATAGDLITVRQAGRRDTVFVPCVSLFLTRHTLV